MAWSREPNRYRGVDRAQAKRIRKRDNHTCQQCGAAGHEVDHKINKARGGSDADTNLQTLCTPCHDAKTHTEAAIGRAKRSGRRTKPIHPALRRIGQIPQGR